MQNMPANVVGYPCCNRGLNNQKLSLLGLVALCIEQDSVLSIPKIADFNPQTSKSEGQQEFADLFEFEAFSRYLRWLGVRHTHDTCDNVDVEEAFKLGNEQDISKRIAFLSALQPCTPLKNLIEMVALKVYSNRPKVALQLRLEHDWIKYSKVRLAQIPREANLLSGYEIIDKVARSIRCRSVYVTCDEASLSISRDVLSRYAKDKHSIKLIWKSDIQDGALPFAAATEFDFHLARLADVFVGTSRSTFANMLCSASPNARHYLYNRDRSTLVKRTDKGMHATAIEATVTWTKRCRRSLRAVTNLNRIGF